MIIRSTWSSRLSYLSDQTSRVGGELQEINERISSGLAVTKPSDAPELTSRIMSIDREISDQARYAEDAGYASSLHDMAGTVLMDLSTVVSDARSLAVQMGSDTYEGSTRVASAEQADQLLEQAINLMNYQVGDRNLFSGQAYDTPAYADDLTYQGSQDASLISVADGIEVTVGFSGDELELGAVLESLQGLREALLSDDSEAVRSSLDGLIEASDIVSKAQTTVGIEQMAALDFAAFSESMGVELEVQVSSLRDDDSLQSLVRLGELQTQYEVTMAMTAKSQLGNLFSRI